MIEAILKTYYRGEGAKPVIEKFDNLRNCCRTAALRNEEGFVTLIEDVRTNKEVERQRVYP